MKPIKWPTYALPPEISEHNRRQRLTALAGKIRRHITIVRVCALYNTGADKRRVTVAIRCINQLARDLYQTNARPVKGKSNAKRHG